MNVKQWFKYRKKTYKYVQGHTLPILCHKGISKLIIIVNYFMMVLYLIVYQCYSSFNKDRAICVFNINKTQKTY